MPIKPNSRGSGAAAGGAAKTAPSDASRIQSSQAKAGNDTSKGSFPARAQAAAARNTNAPAAGAAKGGKAGGKASS